MSLAAVELTKENSEDLVDTWPFMSSSNFPTGIVIVYLIFVKIIGPHMMKKRKPMELNQVMMAYNLIEVFLSIYTAYISLDAVEVYFSFQSRHNYWNKSTFYLTTPTWVYMSSKVPELLDTVFMVLRKKDSQISFLHIYHHSSMVLITWVFLKYLPGDYVLVPIFLNSVIHSLMYSYYFLAALGPKIQKYLWWKKYLTLLQLVQFVSGMLYFTITLINDPLATKTPLIALNIAGVILTTLFLNFYRKSYTKKSK